MFVGGTKILDWVVKKSGQSSPAVVETIKAALTSPETIHNVVTIVFSIADFDGSDFMRERLECVRF